MMKGGFTSMDLAYTERLELPAFSSLLSLKVGTDFDDDPLSIGGWGGLF